MSRGKSPKLFVTKYPHDYDDRDLKKLFGKFGKANIIMKKGYSFIEYEDYHDAQDAIKDLHGKSLEDDFKLVVTESTSSGSTRDNNHDDRDTAGKNNKHTSHIKSLSLTDFKLNGFAPSRMSECEQTPTT